MEAITVISALYGIEALKVIICSVLYSGNNSYYLLADSYALFINKFGNNVKTCCHVLLVIQRLNRKNINLKLPHCELYRIMMVFDGVGQKKLSVAQCLIQKRIQNFMA